MKSNRVLKEGITWEDIKSYGHLGLDGVSVLSSLVPGIGTTVSIGADLSNAYWYYSEGKTLTSALYVIMAIPIVGDIFAIPIQIALKAGGVGLSKIPGIKEAVVRLAEKLPAVKKLVEKMSKNKATSEIAKNADEAILNKLAAMQEKAVTKEEKDAVYNKFIEYLETGLVKESAGETLGKQITKKTMGYLEKTVVKSAQKRVIPKISTVFGDEGSPSPSPVKPDSVVDKDGIRYRICSGPLKYGCRGKRVKEVQQALLSCDYALPRKGADGFFGPETKAAVVKFQSDNSLKAYGIVGAETSAALQRCGLSPNVKKSEPKVKTYQPQQADTSLTKDIMNQQNDLPALKQMQDYYVTPSGGTVEIPNFKQGEDDTLDGIPKKAGKEVRESRSNNTSKLISKRNEMLEKLVFERLVKNANRL